MTRGSLVATPDRSAGSKALLELLQTSTQLEVAKRVGVAQITVSRWASGQRRPQGYAVRLAIWRSLGIPPPDWDRGLNRTD